MLVDTHGPGPLRGAAASGTVTVVTGAEARASGERVWSKYLTEEGLVHPEVARRSGPTTT